MKTSMKAREAFERIRHQKKQHISLKVRLILLVSIELVVCVLIAIGLFVLISKFVSINSTIMLLIDLLIISIVIGITITGSLSKLFFKPIDKLGEAMEKVADGDFSVHLQTDSSSKEIREIYSGFNLMTQELNATEVLQADFVSNVSHEFKTPINAIEGYTTLLQGCDDFNEEQEQYIEKILFNTKRLSTLVGNILLLSKIENQSIQTRQTRFRLDEQVRQSIVALESAWEQKNIEFDVEMEEIEYVGSESLLYHVWDNLIGNAIKFNPNCGVVNISLKKLEDKIVFQIEDSGPGLDEDSKKYIFDKFYQADSSHKQEGNGLGLALVKRILMITNGEIIAENIAGGGSRFIVVLQTSGFKN